MNIYTVKLAKPVAVDPMFGDSVSQWLYVTASSFPNAEQAVKEKFPDAEIRGIDLLNYKHVPIIAGK